MDKLNLLDEITHICILTVWEIVTKLRSLYFNIEINTFFETKYIKLLKVYT